MREAYTLTEEEHRALGGTPPPEGYDPTELKRVPDAQRYFGYHQAHRTGLVPSLDNVLPVWQEVAKRLGIRMLSIRWPDAHYPDFNAEPALGASRK